jgi:hypothetical protein
METNIYTSCCSAFKNPYLPNQSPDSNRSTFKSIKYSASKKILINAGQVYLWLRTKGRDLGCSWRAEGG